MRLDTWLLPQPVRTAVTAITGFARRQHGRIDVEAAEPGAEVLNEAPALVDVGIVDVGIGEHDMVDIMLPDQRGEFFFREYWNPLGIVTPGQHCRVAAVFDVRNLRSRECDDPRVRIVAVAAIEHMKVASRGSHD